MHFKTILGFCAAMAALPGLAAADTVLNFDLTSGSVLAGNPTLAPTAFCAPGSACPSTPAFALGSNDPLSGTVSFDLTTDTMSFDLTLTQNATLGSLTLASGTSFVANGVGVTVGSSTSKGVTTYTFAPGSGDVSTANLLLNTPFTETSSLASIPGLECSATGTSGSCSLTIGTPVAGTNSLEIANGANTYNGVMSISANLTPVPLPPSVLLLLSGLATFGWRRRGASAR